MGRAIWCGLLVLTSAMAFSSQIALGPDYAIRAQHQLEAAILIAVGAPDQKRVAQELASFDFVSAVDRFTIRDLGQSFFATPQARWLATPLRDHFQPAPAAACLGTVDSVERLAKSSPPGVRLTGWAWNGSRRRAPSRIWVTDQQDIIRGLGVTHEPRPDVAAAFGNHAMESAGWVAYAPMPPGGGPLTVYAELGDGNLVCRVGGPRSPAP